VAGREILAQNCLSIEALSKVLDFSKLNNSKRLLEPLGNIPPAEYEKLYYTNQMSPSIIVGLT